MSSISCFRVSEGVPKINNNLLETLIFLPCVPPRPIESLSNLWVNLWAFVGPTGQTEMPKLEKLNALRVRAVAKPGLYSDGGGLNLRVHPHGGKSWSMRYARKGICKLGVNGKPVGREMGLGAYPAVTLAQARIKATVIRAILANDIDPIKHRADERTAKEIAIAKGVTFDWCADQYIEAHKASWRNEKHAEQWKATIRTYASPVFGHLPISAIDRSLVIKAISPIWTKKTETAKRLRGRIEAVLNWAMASEYREEGANPALWRGNIEYMLPKPEKVHAVVHHAALGYSDMPAFVDELMTQNGEAARGLLFTILTAARTGEVRGAIWSEIDFGGREWRIPKERMKADKEHRIPLSDPALLVLNKILSLRKADGVEHSDEHYIFGLPSQGLSNNAFLALLDRMNREVTAHGMRSSFRTWCAEQTNYPREIAETALAHVNKNATEKAYLHTDFFERRRQLMAEWAAFVTTPRPKAKAAKVVSIGKRKGA